MELQTKQRVFYFFPVLFCFCLPFGSQLLSLLIIGWGVSSFFIIKSDQFRKGLRNKWLWLSWFFFLITCVSAAFSDNKQEAATAIEIKLSFLFLPYYFFCFEWPVQVFKRCLTAFVSGCFFSSMFLIVRAAVQSANGNPDSFFYTDFSVLIHPSYLSMYLLLALAIIFIYYPNWFKGHKSVNMMSWLFFGVFIFTIFLCASKMGIICLVISVPLLMIYKWKKRINLKRALIGVAILVLFGIGSKYLFPSAFERLNSISNFSVSKLDKTSAESTTVRALIWKECWTIVKENFLFGLTVGDANDELYKRYEAEGLTGALSHRLNAHNQYFQSFIGLGIFGFVCLLMLTFGGIVKGFIQKNILLLFFSFIVILNFSVESMLQRADGTLFFAFFYCLFNHHQFRNEDLI